MTSGHTTGSRWGIKVTEKLNADWTVRAHLESGIESDTGELSSSGRIFGRQMTISLKNPSFGEIAFGRSGKPLSGSDQFTRIRPFTPFGVTYGDAGLLFYGKGGRIDNAVFYQSPKFAGFTVLAAASTQTSNQEEAEWTDNTRFWGGSIDWKWDEGTKNGPDRSAQLGHNFVYQETKSHGFYSSYFHQRISS